MAYGYGESLNIVGISEIRTKLTAFGENVVEKVTQEGLDAGAEIFKKEAIQNAVKIGNDKEHNLKVDGVYIKLQPGNLSRNIRRRRIRKVEVGTKVSQVYVKGKKAWYAKFVEGMENGTSRQTPKPFMRPAYESKQSEAVQAFENRIDKAVKDGGL